MSNLPNLPPIPLSEQERLLREAGPLPDDKDDNMGGGPAEEEIIPPSAAALAAQAAARADGTTGGTAGGTAGGTVGGTAGGTAGGQPDVHMAEAGETREPGVNPSMADMLKELAEAKAEIAALKLGSVSLGSKAKFDVAKPPRFSGKVIDGGLDVRTWLTLMDEYCLLTNVEAKDRARVISLYLDGRARIMYHSRLQSAQILSPDFVPTLPWVRDLLLSTYGSVDPIALAWTKLEKLKQGSLSVEEYAVGFEQACAELGAEAPHEADRIQRFKAGLNSDIKFRCAARPDGSRWTSFRDFVRCCSLNWQVMQQNKVAKADNVENSAASGQSKRSGNNKQTQNTKPRALSVQASRNKRKRNPYLKKMVGKANGSGLSIPPEEMKRLMDEGRCLHCKQEGHFARECPTNPNAIQRKEKASKG